MHATFLLEELNLHKENAPLKERADKVLRKIVNHLDTLSDRETAEQELKKRKEQYATQIAANKQTIKDVTGTHRDTMIPGLTILNSILQDAKDELDIHIKATKTSGRFRKEKVDLRDPNQPHLDGHKPIK